MNFIRLYDDFKKFKKEKKSGYKDMDVKTYQNILLREFKNNN